MAASSMMMAEPFVLKSLSTLFSLIVVFITAYRISKPKKTYPILAIGKENGVNTSQIFRDAYFKYRDEPYAIPARVPGQPDHVILPDRYIPEFKSLPDTIMDFQGEVVMRHAGENTTLGIYSSSFLTTIKVDLIRSLGMALEDLQDESTFAFPHCLGPCHEWTEIPMYLQTLRIISILSARTLVGHTLCRDEEWIEASHNYTIVAFEAGHALYHIPRFIRTLVAPFVPEWQRLMALRATASRLLTPIIEERIAAMKSDPECALPDDTITFLIRNSEGGSYDIQEIIVLQLLLSIAAIHTTSMTFTQLIYDLCEHHDEVVKPLRDELESVLASDGDILTMTNIPKLRKMDSFLKESQRLNPLAYVGMLRLVKQNHTFSNGLKILKGTSVAVNTLGPSMDPAIFPSPDTFDGFRFSRLREEAGSEAKHQFVTTSLTSLNFGLGAHACPGRPYASLELKVALAYVLRNYDVKFKDGHRRPLNVHEGPNVIPNPMGTVMFKRRS